MVAKTICTLRDGYRTCRRHYHRAAAVLPMAAAVFLEAAGVAAVAFLEAAGVAAAAAAVTATGVAAAAAASLAAAGRGGTFSFSWDHR